MRLFTFFLAESIAMWDMILDLFCLWGHKVEHMRWGEKTPVRKDHPFETDKAYSVHQETNQLDVMSFGW